MPSKELTKNYVSLHEILSDNLEKIRKQYDEGAYDSEVFQDLALAVRQLGPTSAQIRQMETKHKELMVEDEEKKRQKRKAEKEEEKKKKEEEKKKKEDEKKKKEEEKEKKRGDKKAEKTAKKTKEEEANAGLMPPADSKIMCEGYLSKQTSAAIGKRWKKKYFVLYTSQPRIHYYDSQSVAGATSPVAGIFCLLPTFFVQTLTKSKSTPGFPFLIKTASEEYQLVAPTEGELRMWVTTLNRTLTNIATPSTPNDVSILKECLARKIATQEAEYETTQATYQSAKDEDTRTKCLQRAELLQASISACRLARQKLTKTSGASDDPPHMASSAGLSSTSTSSGASSGAGLASSAPASSSAKTKPPVTRSKPPVVRGAQPAPAASASVASSGMASSGMRAAPAGMPAGRAGMAGMQGMQMGMGMQGMQMGMGMQGMPMGGQMMNLPAGMTMQQYQMYQQQQQMRYYQQQMAARAQNPYGWQ
jgi:hypothetical protein